MRRMVVRYTTKPEAAAENQRLIEQVFAELSTRAPEGVRYAVLRLDERSFVHIVEIAEGATPLQELAAFKAFQSGIRDRAETSPQSGPVVIVGNYRMLGE